MRRGLAENVLGRTLASVELRGHRVARRHVPGPQHLSERLAGRRVTVVRRRGKYLWLDLGDSVGLILHLGMSGQLLIEPPDATDEKHLHARFRFVDGGPELRFVDQRTFGGLALARPRRAGGAQDDRPHRARPPRARVRPGCRRPPGQGEGQRDQARPPRPDGRIGHRQHLRRRGAVAGAGARGADRQQAEQAADRVDPRPRRGRHAGGPRPGRHELRRALRERQRCVRLLRPFSLGLRTVGAPLPAVRDPHPA